MSASAFSVFSRSFAVSAAVFGLVTTIPLGGMEAKAGSKTKYVSSKHGHYTVKRQPSRLRGFEHTSRTGVVFGSGRNVAKFKSDVHKRRALINKQNRRIAVENHLRSHRRSGVYLYNPYHYGDPYLGHGRVTIQNEPYAKAGTKVVHGAPTPPCPDHHNCGYRVYENGTGPRIITPGYTDPSLPPQDGLNGPYVITLD